MGIGIISFLSVRYNQCIYDAEKEMLLSIRKDKRKAAAELKAQKESELLLLQSQESEEQKEEEIATENPNNHSHDLSFESHDLPLLPDTGTPCLKRVKTPLSFKQKWNWEFDGIVTEKCIDTKHQSINITNPKIPKTRWSNLKSKAKSIIRKYVPLMSPTKDKL